MNPSLFFGVGVQATWPQLIAAADGAGIMMMAEAMFEPTPGDAGDLFNYFVYAASCVVAEV
jgi:hypothetical protein